MSPFPGFYGETPLRKSKKKLPGLGKNLISVEKSRKLETMMQRFRNIVLKHKNNKKFIPIYSEQKI